MTGVEQLRFSQLDQGPVPVVNVVQLHKHKRTVNTKEMCEDELIFKFVRTCIHLISTVLQV